MSSLRASPRRVWRLIALGILVALPGAPSVALACSCAWAGPFTKVAPGQALIVLGEVRSHHRNSMDVAVVDVVKGVADRTTIRIYRWVTPMNPPGAWAAWSSSLVEISIHLYSPVRMAESWRRSQ
jgi:hypothetical protein